MIENNFIFDQTAKNPFWVVYIPIWLFIIGQLINWIVKIIKRVQETKHYKKWVLFWLKNSISEISNQVGLINDYIHIEKQNNSFQPSQIMLSTIDLKGLVETSIKDYIYYFVINSKGKSDESNDIYDLIINLNSIQNLIDEIKRRHFEYSDRLNQIITSWNTKFIEFNKIVNKHTIEIHSSNSKYLNYYESLNILLKDWVNKDESIKSDMTLVENEILKKILVFLIAVSESDVNNKYALELRELILHEFIVIIKQWKFVKEQNTLWFSTKKTEINNCLEKVKILNEELKATKTKWLLI
jgi:hypothetical protein